MFPRTCERRQYTRHKKIIMVGDPIADMLTRIRNAIAAGRDPVRVPSSKIKEAIADLLVREGYIASSEKKGQGVLKYIEISLARAGEKSKIANLVRVSRPGKRVYGGVRAIHPPKSKYGVAVISTSRGIMTDAQARRARVGGEILFKIF